MLGIEELNDILNSIYEKLVEEITLANRIGEEELNNVLEKYGFENNQEESYSYIDYRNAKILIIGQINIKAKDINGLCKSMGFNPEQIDYVSYNEATNYNYENLRFSNKYSDVIFGATPHKGKGIEDNSSIINFLENNKSEFPNIIRATDSNGLNLNKTTLKSSLLKTRLYTNTFSS